MNRLWALLSASLLMLALGGCQTTGNVSTGYDPGASKNSGLVLFSVSHDKNTEHFLPRGADLQFSVTFTSVDGTVKIPPALSNDTLALFPTTVFEAVWGNVYVREFPAGRYELSGWSLRRDIGTNARHINPQLPPPPIPFEVKPGSITYIGNVHAALVAVPSLRGFDINAGVEPQIRNEAERDMKAILKDYPQLAGKVLVAPLPSGPWKPTAPARPTEAGTRIMQTCMKYEEPLAVERIGQGEIRTRDDATAHARKVCEALVQLCANAPGGDRCRSALTPFGLATEAGSGPSAAALLNAATKGATATVRSLLADGVDPDVRNAVGWTPLMLAAAERHADTVAVLLDAGADPDAQNTLGRTALMFASIYGQDAIVKMLLDRNAKLNIVPNDNSGWTALMAAAARGHLSTVSLLLDHGADPGFKSKDGQSAIDLARQYRHSQVVQKLLDHPARKD
ncbi:MAG: hypothetical protein CVU19_08555 [Betaproteobacteria bacterium HGW-Betaproteobacteria-13]|jgi:hypothetical protein|nr:MAG: hypothetical protein CVU19_08555 [Betaproteobacteria bacterium HGW-Betaproteobacteria-13]